MVYDSALCLSTSSKTPVYHSYHFYNLTNSEAFLAGQPPVVEEVGPFTFEVRGHAPPFLFSYDRYTPSSL